jgi:hypothetical protein
VEDQSVTRERCFLRLVSDTAAVRGHGVRLNVMGKLYSFVESGIGLPHSKTLARFRTRLLLREVLECGSPMPLFMRVQVAHHIQSCRGHDSDVTIRLHIC